MYLEYYGLKDQPFRITPDTHLFYEGGDRGDILQALLYTVQSGEGVVKVVGEVGMGKTMLCRMLERRLPNSVTSVYLANPNLTPDNILTVIATELGITNNPDDKLAALQQLQDWLLIQHHNNRRVVVLIEEAQKMPLDTLEEIRLLSNLETDTEKLLQIVLFGQPELDENLSKYEIRPLTERITHQFYLNAFEEHEILSYLNFRMRSVGYAKDDLFTEAHAKKILQASHGLLRRVNLIADKALLACFVEGKHQLSMSHIHMAIQECQFNNKNFEPISKGLPWRQWGLVAAFLISAVGLLVYLMHQQNHHTHSRSDAGLHSDDTKHTLMVVNSNKSIVFFIHADSLQKTLKNPLKGKYCNA